MSPRLSGCSFFSTVVHRWVGKVPARWDSDRHLCHFSVLISYLISHTQSRKNTNLETSPENIMIKTYKAWTGEILRCWDWVLFLQWMGVQFPRLMVRQLTTDSNSTPGIWHPFWPASLGTNHIHHTFTSTHTHTHSKNIFGLCYRLRF